MGAKKMLRLSHVWIRLPSSGADAAALGVDNVESSDPFNSVVDQEYRESPIVSTVNRLKTIQSLHALANRPHEQCPKLPTCVHQILIVVLSICAVKGELGTA